MTDTMTSQNIDLSSWDTLYIYIYIKVKWSRYRPGVAQIVGRGTMTAALEGGEWSAARPGRTLPPGKTRYPFYRRLDGPQGRSGRAENLVPTGIRSRTVQPVVSRNTDWATHIYIYIKHIGILKIQHYNTLLIFLLYSFPERISRTLHRQTMQQSKLGHSNNTLEITEAIILAKVRKNALYHDPSRETIHS